MDDYYDYINENSIDQRLICQTCLRPLIQPVITPCKNQFCQCCIEETLDEHYLRCDECEKSHLTNQWRSLEDSFILMALDQLEIKCEL